MRRFSFPSSILAFLPLLAMGCGGAASDGPSRTKNVFGTDDRQELRTSDYPYATIGRLETGCTGTLVGKSLVLTAAHCVITTGTGAWKDALKYFHVNVIGGTAKDKVWIEQAWYGTNNPDGTNGERGKDWAILKLAKPAGDTYKFMDVAAPDLAMLPYETNLAGYSTDRDSGNTATIHRGCKIIELQGERLLHDCDAKSGVSGGPMFSLNGTKATIHAISVSEFRNGAADSVSAPTYAANVANVAISTQGVLDTLTKLKATVDAGQAAPTIAGVLTKTQPATNPGPGPGPGPGPTPGTGDTLAATDLIAVREIRNHATALKRSTEIAQESANLTANLARNYGDTTTRAIAIDLANAADGLKAALAMAADTANDAAVPARVASSLSSMLRARTLLNPRITGCTPAQYCNELKPYVGNVVSQLASLRERLVRR